MLEHVGSRLPHVACVARALEDLAAGANPEISDLVVAAGWLHDIGYAPDIAATGFHPLDGARFLSQEGWPDELVRLVAHHSGAALEAETRGLGRELAAFERPDLDSLDVLTFADMTSSPVGERVSVNERLQEILDRYAPEDPVALAVRGSTPELLATVRRVVQRFELADDGFVLSGEGVGEA
jgi:HD superfamily phosphodiesterase